MTSIENGILMVIRIHVSDYLFAFSEPLRKLKCLALVEHIVAKLNGMTSEEMTINQVRVFNT